MIHKINMNFQHYLLISGLGVTGVELDDPAVVDLEIQKGGFN